MNLCDRCYQVGDFTPGTKKIQTSVHESFDLCESCYNEFTDFMRPVKKEKNGTTGTRKTAGRPKKKKA